MFSSFKINNGVKLIHYQTKRPHAKATLALIVKVGSLAEKQFRGMAHCLEHLLLYPVSKQKIPFNYSLLGTTDFDHTVFEIECDNNRSSIQRCVNILIEIYTGKHMQIEFFNRVKNDITKENQAYFSNSICHDRLRLVTDDYYFDHVPVGKKDDIDSMLFSDAKKFHEDYYLQSEIVFSVVTSIEKEIVFEIFTAAYGTHEISRIKRLALNNELKRNHNNTTILIENENSIELYIPMKKQKVEKGTHSMRCLADLACIFIEDILATYIFPESVSKVQKARYGYMFQYFWIIISGANTAFQKSYSAEIASLFSAVIDSISKYSNVFTQVKKDYSKYLEAMPEASIYLLNTEIINNVIYGTEIYEKDLYMTTLEKLNYDEFCGYFKNFLFSDDIKYIKVR